MSTADFSTLWLKSTFSTTDSRYHSETFSLACIRFFLSRWSLASFGSGITFNHIIASLVRSIFGFPGFAFVRKFIHLAGTNGAILLTTRKTDNTKTLEFQWPNSILELGHILPTTKRRQKKQITNRVAWENCEICFIGSQAVRTTLQQSKQPSFA